MILVIYTIFTLLFVAMLTAAETAFSHVPRSQLRSLSKKDKRATVVLQLTDAVHLLPVLRGVNILLVITLTLGCHDRLNSYLSVSNLPTVDSFIISILLASVLLLFSVFVPYVAARNYPLPISLILAWPIFIIYRLAKPITKLFDWMTGHVLRDMVGMDTDHTKFIDAAELGLLIKRAAQTETILPLESELALNSIRLSERRIGSMMTPRTSLCAIDISDTPEIVRQKMMKFPHSRYPLINGSFENVVGIVRLMDLIRFILATDPERPSLEAVSSPHLLVPDSTNALTLLETFKDNPSNLAVAFDEYGNVTGVVTLYDVLETLAGGISHINHASATPHTGSDMTVRADGSYLIDGTMAVEDFFDCFGMEEKIEELHKIGSAYTTVAGFVLANFGRIPSVSEQIELDNLCIEVLDLDGNRIDKLLVTRKDHPQISDQQAMSPTPEHD